MTIKTAERWKEVEKEKLNHEIANLKSQVNPHFLFNTLNGIYSLALQNSKETPGAIVKLSHMMRYVLTDASQDQVLLSHELEYLKSYIDLQQLRFGENLVVDFNTSGDLSNKSIAPLLMIPLIENAFKYGVSPEEKSRIGITLETTRHEVRLEVSNKKVKIQPPPKTGIGLQNVRKRLAHLYPGNHLLSIHEDKENFMITLLLIVS